MAGLAKVAHRFQSWNRQRKVEWLRGFVRGHGVRSILLVGVGGVARYPWENLVERSVADLVPFVVWSGLGVEPRDDRYVAADALRLPFRDGSFDLVFSNAVVEHVGDGGAQAAFVAEHVRVGRSWALTTPNRWFPVESHTRTAVRHWSPAWRSSRPEFTRLLSKQELAELLPPGGGVVGSDLSPTFTAFGPSDR